MYSCTLPMRTVCRRCNKLYDVFTLATKSWCLEMSQECGQ